MTPQLPIWWILSHKAVPYTGCNFFSNAFKCFRHVSRFASLLNGTFYASMSPSTRAGSASAANFYSPHNASFHASQPYSSLQKGVKEIRLIRILSDNDEDLLRCELLPAQNIEDIKYRYLALSYCAGDPTQTAAMVVNGLRFNTFASLVPALCQLRRAVGIEQQLLWVDQICIDQSNSMERAHQVGFMKDIYENAERAMVWLGDQGR